jgi:kinesin family protein 1
MSECLVYQLKPGPTMAGSADGKAQIKLSGTHICEEHVLFTNNDGEVTLKVMSSDARTRVNGKQVQPDEPLKLQHGFRVILGDVHYFRFNVS